MDGTCKETKAVSALQELCVGDEATKEVRQKKLSRRLRKIRRRYIERIIQAVEAEI